MCGSHRSRRLKTTGESGDQTTTWNYSSTRGWLTSKKAADNESVTYTYTDGGRLKTRTWARGTNLTTTYSYAFDDAGVSDKTADLTKIDYSDSTPDVTFRYKRFGKLSQVTDVTGTRTFDHDAYLRLDEETLTSYFSSRVLTYKQGDSATGGRYKGYQLGTSADPDADVEASYGYDSAGRLNRVWIGAPSGTADFTMSEAQRGETVCYVVVHSTSQERWSPAELKERLCRRPVKVGT